MHIDIYRLIQEDSEGSNPELLKFLANYGSKAVFETGDQIVREGEHSDSVFVFLEGEADVVKTDGIGNTSVVGKLSKGTVFGEMGVFLEMKRSASVIAKNRVTLLKFDNQRFFDAIFSMPEFAYKIMKIVTERIDKQNEVIVKQSTLLEYYKVALMIHDAMHELENDFDTIVLDVSHVSVASGISKENAMSIMLHLKQEEIIYDLKTINQSEVHFSVNTLLLENFLFNFLPDNI